MKTAAIIFLGTQSYFDLFPKYAQSIFTKFLPEYAKTIFCFTDADIADPIDNVNYIKINHLTPPLVTLKRFETMLLAETELENFDYIFYVDADMLVVDCVDDYNFENYKFFGVQHPGFINQLGTFEMDRNSTASVDSSYDLTTYYQGCFWGGKSKDVLMLCKVLAQNVNEDLNNNIIAIWQDESHLNKYFINNKCDVYLFSSSYAYPEKWNLNMPKIIVHLDKSSHPSFVG